MFLAIDTSTAACSLALLDGDGLCLSSSHEVIGRGHAEKLMPRVDALLDGRVPSQILVGVGPGSFTGIRVGLSAAHGLALGWDVPLCGMDSLALIAAQAEADEVLVALNGGHGELFVRPYARGRNGAFEPLADVANMPPQQAAETYATPLVLGTGAMTLVEARGSGEAVEALPNAALAMSLAQSGRTLLPSPAYARAPDAVPAGKAA